MSVGGGAPVEGVSVGGGAPVGVVGVVVVLSEKQGIVMVKIDPKKCMVPQNYFSDNKELFGNPEQELKNLLQILPLKHLDHVPEMK